MRNATEVKAKVRAWVAKAELDFRLTQDMLNRNEEWLAGDICFHAEQCAEKYLKARLVFDDIHFPRIHDINELTKLLPTGVRPRASEHERSMLTIYAVTMRYPGDYDAPTIPEARTTVRVARRIRAKIRRSLPSDCIPAE